MKTTEPRALMNREGQSSDQANKYLFKKIRTITGRIELGNNDS